MAACMGSRFVPRAVIFGDLAFVILLGGVLFAAEPTGTIAGSVTDPTGAIVARARVVVTNTATGLTRETFSGTDGAYVFPLLPIGTYTIATEAAGFRRIEQAGIQVNTDQSSGVSTVLQLGSTSESVRVEANAEMVETRSGTLSQVVNERRITELPLAGRNPAALVLLTPGTSDLNAANANGRGDTVQTATYPGSQSITANGAVRIPSTITWMAGATRTTTPTSIIRFRIRMRSKNLAFRQIASAPNTGAVPGAIVNVVTKSGTNQFHATAFEFLRNGDFNMRNFFAAEHDQLKRNQFGGSVGGPVAKDRLFFFGTYQGTQLRNISGGNTPTVLTPAIRSGDFSSVSRQIVDPVTKVPFSGNQIPQTAFSSVTQKLLPLIPVPATPDGFISYDRAVRDQENHFMVRRGYIRGNQRLYGRYFYSKYLRDPVVGSQNLLASFRGFTLFDQSASFSHTMNVSPTLLNNFIFPTILQSIQSPAVQ